MLQAMRIYVYDMLTQNPDRTFHSGGKPNCSQFETGLIAYDFELSFSLVRLILPNAPACEAYALT